MTLQPLLKIYDIKVVKLRKRKHLVEICDFCRFFFCDFRFSVVYMFFQAYYNTLNLKTDKQIDGYNSAWKNFCILCRFVIKRTQNLVED